MGGVVGKGEREAGNNTNTAAEMNCWISNVCCSV